MGASAVRITAADFLTPPEFADRRLAAEGAGRIGGLRLELAAGTSLTRFYQQVPLRVLPLFERQDQRPALIYLLNPTAGLLDGDGQLITIRAGAGSRAVVVGQSATRIHPCLTGFATQQWTIDVADDAVLLVLPGPTIPFRNARYFQRVRIDLAPRASLIWGDIWLAGRYARAAESELFQFNRLVQDMQVHRAGTLVYRDRFTWQGPWDTATAHWHFGQSPACGSVFIAGALTDKIRGTLAENDVAFPTAANDLVLRWQGESESVIAAVVQAALQAAALLADGDTKAAWLLPGHDLAPNHWFSLPATT